MKVYITGIAGFLGSHLADWVLAHGDEVWGWDDLSTGTQDNIPSATANVEYDPIEEMTANSFPRRTDIVFHCAAAAYEGVSHFSPAFISRNIYAGSYRAGDAVGYQLPFSEEQVPDPVDPYGIAKEAAERLLINLCETHGVEWSVVVPHNIYGPRQKYDDPYRNVAAIFANLMLMGQRPVIYGDGYQVRCFSYIDDVVPILARMGLDPKAKGEVINVGPDEGAVPILGLAEAIAEIVGVPFNPVFVPGRPREVRHAVCSSDKARNLLGFEQRTELREGLENLVAYIRERGPKPFVHHLPIEIESGLLPLTWRRKDQS